MRRVRRRGMEGREEERPRARVFLSLCKLDPILDHFTTPGTGSQEEPEPREEAQLPNQPRLLRFPVRVGPPRLGCSVPRAGIILAHFCASLCPDDRCLCDCFIDHRVNYSSILIKADGHVEECTIFPLNILK